MSFDRFCAKCGKTTGSLIDGLCSDCFLTRNSLFEERQLVFERCKSCGKVRIKGNWVPFGNDALMEEIKSKAKLLPEIEQPKVFVELLDFREKNLCAKITVEGLVGGVLLKQGKKLDLPLQTVRCDSCMKLVSNYREAILQLRAGSIDEAQAMRQIAEQLLFTEQAKDSLSAVVKVVRLEKGFDLWIGGKKPAAKVARVISKLYNARVMTSKKIIGEEGGRGNFKYRYTFLIKK